MHVLVKMYTCIGDASNVLVMYLMSNEMNENIQVLVLWVGTQKRNRRSETYVPA
jgi:hypothetical protein